MRLNEIVGATVHDGAGTRIGTAIDVRFRLIEGREPELVAFWSAHARQRRSSATSAPTSAHRSRSRSGFGGGTAARSSRCGTTSGMSPITG